MATETSQLDDPSPPPGKAFAEIRPSVREASTTELYKGITALWTTCRRAVFITSDCDVEMKNQVAGSTEHQIWVHQLMQILNDSWWAELLSWIASLFSLLAIALLLALHDEKPLPQWPRLISINSLVAILAFLVKIGLVMPLSEGISQLKWHWFERRRQMTDLEDLDAASRGPLGCLLLLFKRRAYLLAKCGAQLSILALIVDPFIQQVLDYRYCTVEDASALATIPVTLSYPGDSNWNMALSMEAAITFGALGRPVPLPFSCPTGNCTFARGKGEPSYTSVGICHECNDIRSEILLVPHEFTQKFSWGNDSQSRFILSNTIPGNDWATGPLTGYERPVFAPGAYPSCGAINASMNYEKDPNTFYTSRMLVTDGNNTLPSAFRCALFPCTRTYSASVTSGTFVEQLLSTHRIGLDALVKGPDLNQSGLYYILALPRRLEKNNWVTCSPQPQPTPNHTIIVSLDNFNRTPDSLLRASSSAQWFEPDCVYRLGDVAAQAIRSGLTRFLDNKKQINLGLPSQPNLNFTALSDSSFTSSLSFLCQQSGIDPLTSVNRFFRDVADSITAEMRQNGKPPSSGLSPGVSLIGQTCVSVRWGWLAFPATLVVGTGLFLVVLMIRTSGSRGSRRWKSSALALAFHIPEGQDVSAWAGVARSRSEIYKVASDMEGKVARDGDRSRLVFEISNEKRFMPRDQWEQRENSRLRYQ